MLLVTAAVALWVALAFVLGLIVGRWIANGGLR